jgi:predicted kinase
MRTMYIMRGLPGSGKSTAAKTLFLSLYGRGMDHIGEADTIFSTDNYWLRPDSYYDFNPSLLGRAHAWNQEQVRKAVEEHFLPFVIVDNTNIRLAWALPYVQLAERNRWDVQYVVPETPWAWDVEECAKRNTHGVPLAAIAHMKRQFEPHEGMVWPILT